LRSAQRLSASDIATRPSSGRLGRLCVRAQRLSASDIATRRRKALGGSWKRCSTPLGIGYRYATFPFERLLLIYCAQRLSASDIATRSNTSNITVTMECSTPLGIGYRYAHQNRRNSRFQDQCSTPLGIGYRYAITVTFISFIILPCSTPLGIGYRYASQRRRWTIGLFVLNASRHRISLRFSPMPYSPLFISSAQRLSASDIATHSPYRSAKIYYLVLNASRHRISLRMHPVKPSRKFL